MCTVKALKEELENMFIQLFRKLNVIQDSLFVFICHVHGYTGITRSEMWPDRLLDCAKKKKVVVVSGSF